MTALTIDPQFGGVPTDYSQIEELCRRLGVPYVIRRSSLGHIIFEERKEKNPCSLCARMRRGMLHNMAKEAGCDRIALGHHFDDAVETFFMNLLECGTLGCFSPRSYLSRKDLTLIRPMPRGRQHGPAGNQRTDRRFGKGIPGSAGQSHGGHAAGGSGRMGRVPVPVTYSVKKDLPQVFSDEGKVLHCQKSNFP